MDFKADKEPSYRDTEPLDFHRDGRYNTGRLVYPHGGDKTKTNNQKVDLNEHKRASHNIARPRGLHQSNARRQQSRSANYFNNHNRNSVTARHTSQVPEERRSSTFVKVSGIRQKAQSPFNKESEEKDFSKLFNQGLTGKSENQNDSRKREELLFHKEETLVTGNLRFLDLAINEDKLTPSTPSRMTAGIITAEKDGAVRPKLSSHNSYPGCHGNGNDNTNDKIQTVVEGIRHKDSSESNSTDALLRPISEESDRARANGGCLPLQSQALNIESLGARPKEYSNSKPKVDSLDTRSDSGSTEPENTTKIQEPTKTKSSAEPTSIRVKSSKKNIVHLSVDVIVSSDNYKLQSGGMVGRLVSEMGGPQLQRCKDIVLSMCKSVDSWTFQPTPATGSLKCKHVFHTVVPTFSNENHSEWIGKIKKLIHTILRRTEQLGYETIAIPILGTGKNSAPHAFITDLICDAIKEYKERRPSVTSLDTIILVHPDSKVEKYIEKRIKELGLTSDDKPRKSIRQKSSFSHIVDVPTKKSDECPICLEEFKASKLKQLSKCKHIFCAKCINECFKRSCICPICNMVYGERTGTQPLGIMVEVFLSGPCLPGYQNCGIIKIFYYFPNGVQGKEHPNPGLPFSGTKRAAYLPDNEEGQKVHRLFRRAFDRRVLFTIGSSRTSGKDNVITWNDIHHKTNVTGGPEKFGYPDPNYLSRVLEELAAKGISEE